MKSRVFAFAVEQDLIEKIKNVPKWAMILHDKDCDLNTGELKKPHYHYYMEFLNPRSISGISKEFGIPENMIQVVHQKRSALAYLLHHTEKAVADGKYQYSRDELLTNIEDFNFDEIVSSSQGVDYYRIFNDSNTIKEAQVALLASGEDINSLQKFYTLVKTFRLIKGLDDER